MADEQIVTFKATRDQLDTFRAVKRTWSERYIRPRTEVAFRALTAAISPAPENNVVGVGIGEKLSRNRSTGLLAIKFLVQIKYPDEQIDKKHRLPTTIEGLPVDVEQVGKFRKFAAAPAFTLPDPRKKIRPAQPGCSVGFRDPNNAFTMAGTFGAVVRDEDGIYYILSNNHVLADEGRLPLGAAIFQPGLLDGGKPTTDKIAELTKFLPLDNGKVDCAIARVTDNALVSKDVLYIGAPQGTKQAQINMNVHKFGRTTSYTEGRVTSIATDVSVGYDTGSFTFEDQIIIVGQNGQPFSAAGDSGSLILEYGTQSAVGLLFAGSSTHTIANHIGDVLQALQVSLA